MSEISDVSSQFIEESKLCQTMSKSRKGGRYSKKNRQERRNEVYRLHFSLGYSARKISDLIKINRNTINNDVKFLYSQLKKNLNELDSESLIMKQILRMEEQRTRLLEQVEKTESLDSKLSLEKMIMYSDNRLSSMYLKLRDTEKIMFDVALTTLNEWLENMELDVRAVREQDLRKLSKPTYDKITKLIAGDKISWNWQGEHKEKKK
jgi:hypothetical protein